MAFTILSYDQVVAAGPSVSGAKSWILARLGQWGFPVPPGLVIAATDDRDLRASARLAPLVAAVGRLDAADLAGPEAAARLAELRERLLATPFADDQMPRLAQALAEAGLASAALAVRSSATGEDGERHSFAGVHDSVLNVRGVDAVAQAIRFCQVSLWTPRAVAYRRRFAIPDADCLAAVLICRMVTVPDGEEPEAAGVAFTADPMDGRRNRIVVEAVPGLGDKLVAGRATPTRRNFVADQWDVVEVMVEAPPSSPLSPETARRVARLALRLHWALGDGSMPQDIEWAFDGKAVTILQARPVTVLPRRGFEGLAAQPVLWSNANLKEVLPAVPTLLTWSVMQPGISHILFDAHRAAGLAVPEGMPLLRRFDGRPYFDIAAQQWAAWDCFGLPPAEFNRLLGGSQAEIDLPPGSPMAGPDGRRRIARQLRLLPRLWGLARRLRPRMATIHGRARAVRHGDLAHLTPAELAALGRAWLAEVLSLPIQLANTAGGVWLGIARQIAAAHLPAEAADALVSRLMAGLGEVTSAEHAYRLQVLARLKGSPGFDGEWRDFLRLYGHRGFGECELANPRWDEDPSGLAALLDGLAAAPRNRSDAEAVRREAGSALAALPPLARRLVRWMAGKAHAGYALREESKSCLVATLGVLRHMAREVGRRMTASGRLDQPDAVFDLSAADILAWLDGDWDGRGATALAADHRCRRQAWQSMPPPLDVVTEKTGPRSETAAAVTASGEPGVWRGLAVSPGQAKGPACLLADPAEAARLTRGGILVARATDPGWTPLFLLAGGVVAEAGGYLSHSAIVAREFGLPAVVNVPGILGAVSPGETLVVDGERGRIERRSS